MFYDAAHKKAHFTTRKFNFPLGNFQLAVVIFFLTHPFTGIRDSERVTVEIESFPPTER